MDSGKVTAVATSVIAISIIGFIGFEIYNDPKNVEARCEATYNKSVEEGPGEYLISRGYFIGEDSWEKAAYRNYETCVREARRYN